MRSLRAPMLFGALYMVTVAVAMTSARLDELLHNFDSPNLCDPIAHPNVNALRPKEEEHLLHRGRKLFAGKGSLVKKRDPVFVSEHVSVPSLDGSTHLTFTYSGLVKENVISLDMHLDVISVECFPEEGLRIHLSDSTIVEEWDAGAIVVGGSMWACEDEEKGSSQKQSTFYHKIQSVHRSATNPSLVFLETVPLQSFAECFHELDLSLIVPPPSKSTAPSDTSSATSNADPAEDIDDDSSMSHHRELIDFGDPQAINQYTLAVAGFNYDDAKGGAKKLLTLWSTKIKGPLDSTLTASLTCPNCYAYMKTGLRLQFSFKAGLTWLLEPYVDNVHARVELFGEIGVHVNPLLTMDYVLKYDQDFEILPDTALGKISFVIGPIPILITFQAGCKFNVNVDASAHANVTVSSGFTKSWSAGFQLVGSTVSAIEPSSDLVLEPVVVTAHAEAKAELKLTLIPSLSVNFEKMVTVTTKVMPYVGIAAAAGEFSTCRQQFSLIRPISYRTFYGVDANVEVGTITLFSVPFVNKPMVIGSTFGLPYKKDLTIFEETDFTCDICRGCIVLGPVIHIYEWLVSDWSRCSANCAGGMQTRTVQCVDKATGTLAPKLRCKGARPDTSVPCNIDACPPGLPPSCDSTTCDPTVCSPNVLGDGVCNAECNTVGCCYDNADCYDRCKAFTTCHSCSLGPGCGWCANSNTCMSATSNTMSSSCAPVGKLQVCFNDEPPLKLSTTAGVGSDGVLATSAGSPLTLNWIGGNSATTKLQFAYSVGKDPTNFLGHNIPSVISASLGTVPWTIPLSFPTPSSIYISVYSSTTATNSDTIGPINILSATFNANPITNVLPNKAVTVRMGSKFTVSWQGGVTGDPVTITVYNPFTKTWGQFLGAPSGSQSTTAVRAITFAVPIPSTVAGFGYQIAIQSVSQPSNRGLSAQFTVQASPLACSECNCAYNADPTRWISGQSNDISQICRFYCDTGDPNQCGNFGCTAGNPYSKVCDPPCDDGCNNAQWVADPYSTSKTCSVPCGGGIQKVTNWFCSAPYKLPQAVSSQTIAQGACSSNVYTFDYTTFITGNFQCDSTRCTDVNGPEPAGIPCNTQPCAGVTSLSWVTSQWTSCSAPCGGGSQSRNVTCISSDSGAVAVADSVCSSLGAKPAMVKTCNVAACPTYSYITSDWSPCGVACGVANRTRTATCMSSLGFGAPAGLCIGVIPDTVQVCSLPICEPPIAVQANNPDKTLYQVGDTVTISWMSQVTGVQVLVSTDVGETFNPLPTQPTIVTSNTDPTLKSMVFTLDSTYTSKNVFLMVQSSTQPTNSDVTSVISLLVDTPPTTQSPNNNGAVVTIHHQNSAAIPVGSWFAVVVSYVVMMIAAV